MIISLIQVSFALLHLATTSSQDRRVPDRLVFVGPLVTATPAQESGAGISKFEAHY